MSDFRFDARRDFMIALCSAPNLGAGTIVRILEECELRGLDEDAFFKMNALQLEKDFGLKPQAAQALAAGATSLHGDIERYWERAEGRPINILAENSPVFPDRVRGYMKNSPGLMFSYGNIEILRQNTFCVACSRDATPAQLDEVEKAVEEGVLRGELLVTGANTDAYRRGAVVPLRWGSPRVLVLDRGLFKALGDGLDQEPFRAARLWRYKFDASTDLAITCVRPDIEYVPGANQQRDELVFALSDRVDVVHLSSSGRSKSLVDRMAESGRTVVNRQLKG